MGKGDSATVDDEGATPPHRAVARPLDTQGLDLALGLRIEALCQEGRALWSRFDSDVRRHAFHPFVAADYAVVLKALLSLRTTPGLRFLEWGSATGVITIMADLLGFEAYGIEIDAELVRQARGLARRTGSGASFTAGSFIPTGYQWSDPAGDHRTGTIADGLSGYEELGLPLGDFDVVFGYPWVGEEPVMLDLMKRCGRPGARLLLHTTGGLQIHGGGKAAAA